MNAVEPGYIVAVAVVAGLVTFTLRALPFALLRPLRESALVGRLAVWMPAGVLTVLALVMFLDSASLAPGSTVNAHRLVCAALAAAVTVAVHLLCGRRTLLSIGAGTFAYILLLSWLG
ncbi:AzlD domain-containing protein [Micrococcus sp.]|uniref:AzlD domain-containing protein n=1 Tax=Micrococcus sp. TaxID=1271 RepID=UPI002A919D4B|nr:AzlD domain-containing protein [Micrococcus sp.]MDY6054320.1 AzlD domain-containing protein [Micrococcus sp.]